MPSKYFISDALQDVEDGGGVFFLAFIAGATTFLCLFFAVRTGLDSVRHAKYLDQARPAQAVLIERVRIPRNEFAPLFYLRYKYENVAANETCSVDFETRLTPRDRGCRVTIDRIQVNETAYRAAKVPSKVDILYVPSHEVSWSQVEGHTPRHKRSLILAILVSFFGLLLGRFTVKLLRLL